ncbi:UvrD-like helicase C-terminal domain-containing protein [Pseudomonas sp. ok272]|uniref:3'-5' exonuclease n=1 Tax=unclassified Pseudomonas TaxID=196821 RepID=UPI0008C6844A|nr:MULTISPECIES: 3'-5' exonuclease [unclassified Pseudomonas]SEN50508.1 UvrD-like helicase C-terminal domain-containing protein [Pseudomonas sp. ok272]SFN29535.1 UvrD-like helicase C-terminal domain-containing protein [Pseudomonas sp. ok602]
MRDEQGQDRALDDMAVTYRSTAQAQRIERTLSGAGIVFASGVSAKGRGTLYGSEDVAKIVSMHSSKGLEFGLVLIPSLGDVPEKGEDEADEARLLYVAITRVIDRLVMTYREPSSFTRKIQDSICSVRQHLDEMDSQKVAG